MNHKILHKLEQMIHVDRIEEQNSLILDFAQRHSVKWLQHHKHSDIFIGTYKP